MTIIKKTGEATLKAPITKGLEEPIIQEALQSTKCKVFYNSSKPARLTTPPNSSKRAYNTSRRRITSATDTIDSFTVEALTTSLSEDIKHSFSKDDLNKFAERLLNNPELKNSLQLKSINQSDVEALLNDKNYEIIKPYLNSKNTQKSLKTIETSLKDRINQLVESKPEQNKPTMGKHTNKQNNRTTTPNLKR